MTSLSGLCTVIRKTGPPGNCSLDYTNFRRPHGGGGSTCRLLSPGPAGLATEAACQTGLCGAATHFPCPRCFLQGLREVK